MTIKQKQQHGGKPTLNPNPNPQWWSMELRQEMFIKLNRYERRLEKKIRYHLFIHVWSIILNGGIKGNEKAKM